MEKDLNVTNVMRSMFIRQIWQDINQSTIVRKWWSATLNSVSISQIDQTRLSCTNKLSIKASSFPAITVNTKPCHPVIYESMLGEDTRASDTHVTGVIISHLTKVHSKSMFWLSMRVFDFHVTNANQVLLLKAPLLLTRKRNTSSSSRILTNLSCN